MFYTHFIPSSLVVPLVVVNAIFLVLFLHLFIFNIFNNQKKP